MTVSNIAMAVVVGAAGGIGREVVKQLAPHRRVIAVVLDDAQAEQARQAGASLVVLCDLSDKAAVSRALAEITTALAGEALSALVNCAAIQPIGVCEAVPRAQFEQVFEINFFSNLDFVQTLLPALRRGRGRIVLFSSLLGRVAAPLVSSYAASKFALEGYADALRRELRSGGISVSLIEPGHVDTPMAAAQVMLAERAIDALDDKQRGHYESLYRAYGEMATGAAKNSTTPAKVAEYAVRAVLSDNAPKHRYLVGGDAKAMVLLNWLLPSAAMDWVFRKLLKQ